jgi:transposase
MLSLPTHTRIYLAVAPVDMRKSFDGLCAIVIDTLKQNPLDGQLFLFRGKSGNRIKALFWDRNGLVIFYKRLEKGRFKWPQQNTSALEMTEQDLSLLLDGIDFTKLKRLPKFNATSAL